VQKSRRDLDDAQVVAHSAGATEPGRARVAARAAVRGRRRRVRLAAVGVHRVAIAKRTCACADAARARHTTRARVRERAPHSARAAIQRVGRRGHFAAVRPGHVAISETCTARDAACATRTGRGRVRRGGTHRPAHSAVGCRGVQIGLAAVGAHAIAVTESGTTREPAHRTRAIERAVGRRSARRSACAAVARIARDIDANAAAHPCGSRTDRRATRRGPGRAHLAHRTRAAAAAAVRIVDEILFAAVHRVAVAVGEARIANERTAPGRARRDAVDGRRARRSARAAIRR